MVTTIFGVSGAVWHLAINPEVPSSNHSPGQKFFQLPCVHPALNGLLGLLRFGETKGDEESNGKLPHNVCRKKSGPYARNEFGDFHFTFTLLYNMVGGKNH